jgi:thiosulfate/3-mercaptopyruvate sulfurtransferase
MVSFGGVRGDALVTTDWLAARLGDPNIRVVDATWYLPTANRLGRTDYDARRIPGAVFWDIGAIADPTTKLPHMLPDGAAFERHMAELGIGDQTHVVVYDGVGMMTAARVWWTLRHFGHDAVSVLDGGLIKWMAEGRPVDAKLAAPPPKGTRFTARPRPELVRSLEAVRANIATEAEQVLDARSAGRFLGVDPEPRPNSRSGHIPGSLSLPYTELIDPTSKTLLPVAQLARKFDDAGIDPKKPVVTSCGSGVTACVLALGLHLLGRDRVAVYDGSWSEWGTRQDTPIET